MLKQTVKYVDFDGNDQEEVLYFNLAKTRVTDDLSIKDRIEEVEALFRGDERELSSKEMQLVINLIKEVMRLSYGVRTQNGKGFRQTPEVWNDFIETPAYDTFLFSFFEEPQKIWAFINAVMPKEVVEEAERIAKEQSPELFVEEDTRPKWEKENRKPTPIELQNMSHEELVYATKYQQSHR